MLIYMSMMIPNYAEKLILLTQKTIICGIWYSTYIYSFFCNVFQNHKFGFLGQKRPTSVKNYSLHEEKQTVMELKGRAMLTFYNVALWMLCMWTTAGAASGCLPKDLYEISQEKAAWKASSYLHWLRKCFLPNVREKVNSKKVEKCEKRLAEWGKG